MRCSRSPGKQKPTIVNTFDSPDGDSHNMRQWLEGEVRGQLTEINQKLEELSERVDRCLNSFTGFSEMQVTYEKLLGKVSEKVPLSCRSTSSNTGKPSSRSNSEIRSCRWDLPPPVPEAHAEEHKDQSPQSPKVEPFDGELTPLLQKTPWTDKKDPLSAGKDKLPRRPSLQLNSAKNVRRGWWIEAVTNFLDEPESSRAAWVYDKIMTPFIFLSVCVTLSQTSNPELLDRGIARTAEIFIDAMCAFELVTRFLFAPSRCSFFCSPYNIIDTLTALPLIVRASVDFEVPQDDKSLERYLLLCCVPVVRLLKMLRRFQQFHLLLQAFKQAFEALPVLLFTLCVIVLTFSSAIFYVEPRDNIDTLPKAIWLAIVTMTTVGYGDVVPHSTGGSLIVAFLTIFSVLYMAMPLGIIGYSFTQIWKDRDKILLMHRTRERLAQWGFSVNDIVKVFKLFDHDQDGALNLDEFRDFMEALRIGLNDERIMALFHIIDADGGGSIDDEEFTRTLFPLEYHSIYASEHA